MTTPLRTYGHCASCHEAVHTDGQPSGPQGGRGWVHTATGNYTCVGGLDTFVDPLFGAATDTRLDEAYSQGHEEGRDEGYDVGYETGCEEGQEKAFEQGLREGREAGYEEGYRAAREDAESA